MSWLKEMRSLSEPEILIGIDEAGRGPLIGDMVVAGVMGAKGQFEKLAEIGVKDSKKLQPHQRYHLYKEIVRSDLYILIIYVPPFKIDSENLNKLLASSIRRILGYFSRIVLKNDKSIGIIIDEVKGIKKIVEKYARELFKQRLSIFVMEPHADSKYIPVSTASIVAKISRDKNIEILKKLLGDFGSGYPSDPLTREWLIEKQLELTQPPLILRRSWHTVKDLAPLWYREKGKISKNIMDFTIKK
ncbi:MAG: ribonuclease HII [Desulfurococcaceae archaeon]